MTAKGRYFEVRKGRASDGQTETEEESDENFEVELPRSIIQEQEEEDLKKRFDRDTLPDIAERHSAVKVTEPPPATMARRAGGKWFLALMALLMLAAAGTTFKKQIIDALKNAGVLSK